MQSLFHRPLTDLVIRLISKSSKKKIYGCFLHFPYRFRRLYECCLFACSTFDYMSHAIVLEWETSVGKLIIRCCCSLLIFFSRKYWLKNMCDSNSIWNRPMLTIHKKYTQHTHMHTHTQNRRSNFNYLM